MIYGRSFSGAARQPTRGFTSTCGTTAPKHISPHPLRHRCVALQCNGTLLRTNGAEAPDGRQNGEVQPQKLDRETGPLWQTSGSSSIHRRARRPAQCKSCASDAHRNPVLARIQRDTTTNPFLGEASSVAVKRSAHARSLDRATHVRSVLAAAGGICRRAYEAYVRCDPPSYPYTDRLLLHDGANTSAHGGKGR